MTSCYGFSNGVGETGEAKAEPLRSQLLFLSYAGFTRQISFTMILAPVLPAGMARYTLALARERGPLFPL
jgi:hypothetical protein